MAAAMRSALARFGRRACITAPPSMPPLRQAAVRNVEGLQWYSNESSRMADKKKWLLMKGNSEMFFSTWSKRSGETLKAIMKADHYLHALTMFGLGIYSIYVMATFGRLKPYVKGGSKDGKD